MVSKVCYGILEGVFSHLPCYCNELSFSQQCVGSGAASLSAAHLHKTWHCRKEIYATCLSKHVEKHRFGHRVVMWSPRFVTEYWKVFFHICFMLLQWVELFATVRWKWGCQPFSCPCSQNVTLPKGDLKTGLSKHVERHRFGHGVVVSKVCYGILEGVFPHLLHAIAMSWAFRNSALEVWLPAFQLPMFAKCETAERRFMRHACLRNPCLLWNLSLHFLPEAWVSEVCYGILEGVFSHSPCYCRKSRLSSSQQCVGSVAASLSAAHVRKTWHCGKEIYATCLFEESMPFVKSKSPLSTRSLSSLRAAARSALCLHYAWKRSHPFVRICVSCREA